MYSEVIDVLDEKVICQDFPQTPYETYYARGGLIDGTPVVCGGYLKNKCFTITNTSADFLSTHSRYGRASSSIVVINYQGNEKLSPLFKTSMYYL